MESKFKIGDKVKFQRCDDTDDSCEQCSEELRGRDGYCHGAITDISFSLAHGHMHLVVNTLAIIDECYAERETNLRVERMLAI